MRLIPCFAAAIPPSKTVNRSLKLDFDAATDWNVGHNLKFFERDDTTPLWDLTAPTEKLVVAKGTAEVFSKRYYIDLNCCGGADGYEYRGHPMRTMYHENCKQWNEYVAMNNATQNNIGRALSTMLRWSGCDRDVPKRYDTIRCDVAGYFVFNEVIAALCMQLHKVNNAEETKTMTANVIEVVRLDLKARFEILFYDHEYEAGVCEEKPWAIRATGGWSYPFIDLGLAAHRLTITSTSSNVSSTVQRRSPHWKGSPESVCCLEARTVGVSKMGWRPAKTRRWMATTVAAAGAVATIDGGDPTRGDDSVEAQLPRRLATWGTGRRICGGGMWP